MSQTSFTVVPAYGRDYTSAGAAIEDWNRGCDFLIDASFPMGQAGRMISRGDQVKYAPGAEVRIRYNGCTHVVLIKEPI
jgi:hypothetical protein